jgi:hypothetical protein
MLAKAALNELTDVGAVREVMAKIPGKGKAKGNERAALEVVPGVIPRSPGSPVPGVVQEATQGAQEPPGAPTTTAPGAAEVAQADPGAAARGVAGGGAAWINRANAEVGASLAAGLPVAPVIDRLVSELPAPTMPDPFTKGRACKVVGVGSLLG